MPTFTPFLCRVTPYGTPFFVSLEPSSNVFIIGDLSAEDVCRLYWLLESVTINYKLMFSGSLEVRGELAMGGMYGTVPRQRLLGVPNFRGSIFHSSSGVQSESYIDFSKIYFQSNGLYAVAFDFVIYSKIETEGGSNFLVSLYRNSGSSGQRDSYKTKTVNFSGKNFALYLNYNSQIWTANEIEFNEFSMTTVFYENA
jgi:hypothetical protein